MLAHYSQAAMVAENRRLAAPASVDSLPTSAMQEDHVSMGWGAARKLVRRRRLEECWLGSLRGRGRSARAPRARDRCALAALRLVGARARFVARTRLLRARAASGLPAVRPPELAWPGARSWRRPSELVELGRLTA